MPGAKELIIPVRMDPKGTEAGLKTVGDAGRKAGDDIYSAFRKAGKGAEEAKESTASMMVEMLKAEGVSKGMELIAGAGEAIGETMEKAAEHAKELALEFMAIQKQMQEIAAMTGHKPTTEFTAQEIKKAAAVGVIPEEWIATKKAFAGQAQAFIGQGPGKKMTEPEAEAFQGDIAAFAKAKGVEPGALGEMAGGMLAQEKGPVTAKEMAAKLGKVYGTLEGAGGAPTERLAGLQKLTALGYTAEGAAQTLAMMKQVAPHREAFALQSIQMGIEEGLTKGTIGTRQGVKEGMDPREEMKALATFLHAKAERGRTPQERQAILNREAAEMVTQPKSKMYLARLGELGPAAFEQAEARTAAVPADEIQQRVEEHRRGTLGKREKTLAELAAARAVGGEEEAPARDALAAAEVAVEKSGALLDARRSNTARDLYHFVSQLVHAPTAEEQLVQTEALRETRRKAQEAGVNIGPSMPVEIQGLAPKYEVEKELTRLLKLTEEANQHAKDQNATLKQIAGMLAPAVAPPPAKGPIYAPPPPGAGRFGGG